ncbi:MAG: aldehyde dehydrogenase family protein [Candidimonas sp.]|nr:MAG: aldehyde dehydrogenase family protein [Candidimonas sp.]
MDTKNLIGGEWTDSAAGLRADSIDPADGKVIGSFPDSSVEDARAAISAARDRFRDPNWAENPRLRQMAMLRWADALERQVNELARLLTRENGKTLGQSRGEIVGAISEVRYYAGLARVVAGRALEVEPGGFSTVLKEPAGVAAIIIPWNAPAVLLVRALAPALAAGCTAVIKPAPQAAQITAAMVRALHEVDGLPEGVVNLVTETGSGVAQEFVASREVAVVSFTGSSQTGQRIMAAAAPTMKKLSLELGGKSCALVFPDADVPRVASLLARAAVIISGQQCTAARRVLVHASRYDAMKAALKEALGAMVVAPGTRPGADMGPLIDQSALAHVTSRIEQTMDECDEVILRGARLGGDLSGGFFVSPTLVAHRDTSAFFCQEEIFGPLVVVERFDDEREAVARANHTEFGLSASVWTNDGARALRVARALHDGTVWINDHNKLFAEAEAGGYLRSGLGRLHGYEALMDFLEVKHIYQSVGVVQADSV